MERAKGVCVMVVGCVEHHGKHLPLGQDMIHTAGVVELAAQKEPVVIFPHMYFSEKQGAGEFKGTIIFSTRLMLDLLKESCSEMARNGFKKIILVNGHGDLMETAMTLAIRPDLVDMSKVSEVDGRSTGYLSHLAKAGFYTPFDWMSSFSNSYASDAHDGNNERIGKTFLKETVHKTAEAFRLIKDDNLCEEYLKEWLSKQE